LLPSLNQAGAGRAQPGNANATETITVPARLANQSLTAPNTSWDSMLKRESIILLLYFLAAAQKGP